MRNRIRSGLPLSPQVAIHDLEPIDDISSPTKSPEEMSENVMSSGVNNLRLSRQPIGTQHGEYEVMETSEVNIVLSSKPLVHGHMCLHNVIVGCPG